MKDEAHLPLVDQSIYVVARMVQRRIGQKCAWNSYLSPEEEALAHAASKLISKNTRQYPKQAAQLDEFERTYKDGDPSIAAFFGKADLHSPAIQPSN